MKKRLAGSSSYQGVFFFQFLERKVVGLNAKVLPTCINAQDTRHDFFLP